MYLSTSINASLGIIFLSAEDWICFTLLLVLQFIYVCLKSPLIIVCIKINCIVFLFPSRLRGVSGPMSLFLVLVIFAERSSAMLTMPLSPALSVSIVASVIPMLTWCCHHSQHLFLLAPFAVGIAPFRLDHITDNSDNVRRNDQTGFPGFNLFWSQQAC